MSRTARRAAAISATACLSLVAAACGGSSAGRVAQIGTTAATAATTSSAAGAVAFSHCMRSHGVPAYPDPTTQGLLPKKSLQELGVSSSVFQAAQGACIHLVPNGGQPSPTQVAQYRSMMLRYARCIRAHGVPNMPDPDSRGHLDIGPGTGVDVNGPRFQAAYRACRKDLAP